MVFGELRNGKDVNDLLFLLVMMVECGEWGLKERNKKVECTHKWKKFSKTKRV